MAKVEAARRGTAPGSSSRARASTRRLPRPRAIERETGATFVHAFEDPRVVAGQGTLGLELVDQLPPGPGTVVIPVGGGGLAAGIALALDALPARAPASSASRPPRALRSPGVRPIGTTIADGIAVKHPGELTRPILDELLDDVVVVDDEEISQAIVLLLERAKLVVEGAGAAPVAALLAGRVGGEGPVLRDPRGRQRRRDDAQLGHPLRADRLGAAPRRRAAHPGPPGRARPDRRR